MRLNSELNNHYSSNSNEENEMDQYEDDTDDVSNMHKSFLNKLSNESIDKLRANSFSNWPLITPSQQHMINGGWIYTNIADRVLCVYCDAIYHKWQETDSPYEIHCLKSPKCPFVLRSQKSLASSSKASIQITNEPSVSNAVITVNNLYASSINRYATFKTWPHTEENPLPSIESFVDAGFYYTG